MIPSVQIINGQEATRIANSEFSKFESWFYSEGKMIPVTSGTCTQRLQNGQVLTFSFNQQQLSLNGADLGVLSEQVKDPNNLSNNYAFGGSVYAAEVGLLSPRGDRLSTVTTQRRDGSVVELCRQLQRAR